MESPIQLSVVATSRNDNHGKNLLYRMQHFVDGFIEQCKRHSLRAELILVDWNPPEGKLSLAEVLRYPKDKGPCSVRIIQVPPEVHAKLDNADKIHLFQMIAKNVGIRRAKGQFVLATNIDVLFSDSLMKFIKAKLRPGILYRVDRLDIPEQLPETTCFDEILRFCASNFFRINSKQGTIHKNKSRFFKIINTPIYNLIRHALHLIKSVRLTDLFNLIAFPIKKFKKIIKITICLIFPNNSFYPHTNACGDFTLLSYEDWSKLKGYPEWAIFSWHIDSVLLYQARQHGIKELDLPRKLSIYHIEHEVGSGYSAEGAHTLFNRLETKGIPYLSNSDLKQIIAKLTQANEKVIYNDHAWGFGNIQLKEFVV